MKAPYLLSGAISTEGLTVIAAAAVALRCVNGSAEQLSAIVLLVGGLARFGLRRIDRPAAPMISIRTPGGEGHQILGPSALTRDHAAIQRTLDLHNGTEAGP